jgi:hypothetical protein
MRGRGQSARSLFSYVSLEERVPQRHPLRRIRSIVDEALESGCGADETNLSHPNNGHTFLCGNVASSVSPSLAPSRFGGTPEPPVTGPEPH